MLQDTEDKRKEKRKQKVKYLLLFITFNFPLKLLMHSQLYIAKRLNYFLLV